jgi:Transglutaminase-like superfamily
MGITVVVCRPEARLSLRRKVALGVEILAAYARVRWLLRKENVPGVVEALRAIPSPEGVRTRTAREDELVGLRLGRAVVRVLDFLPSDSRCLVRSLVLTRLLARRRICSALVIGVTSEPAFAAHAWVETGEVPLLCPHEPNYAALVRL